jgi:excisionase family DNA binding protein
MERYYAIGETAEILGVSVQTLRRWDKLGKLSPDVRTGGGHRRYSETALRQFLGKPLELPGSERKVVLYARVPRGHKDELQAQVDTLKAFCAGKGWSFDEVLAEVGSALNTRRPKLRRLLKDGLNGRVDRVIVTHRDRLARFGADLIEDVLKQSGVELVAINRSDQPDSLAEVSDDLVELARSLCADVYEGSRAQCRRASKLAKELVQALEGRDEGRN